MAALPESRGALHLKHSILLAKLCSLHPDLQVFIVRGAYALAEIRIHKT